MIDTKALRQKILDLAIRGLLVPQDPNDEPASVLLEKIRAEKQQLIKEGKIKKDKSDSIIYKGDDNRHYEKVGNLEPKCIDELRPFVIPNNWKWVRFSTVGILKNGYSFKSSEYANSGIQVVRISDLGDNEICQENAVYYPFFAELNDYLVVNGSFLICQTGSIGKIAWVRDNKLRYLNQRVGMFIPYDACNKKYLWYFLHTNYVLDIWLSAKTSMNGNIKNSDILDILLPLPPISEQERIVSCVEQLLSLVTTIEENQIDIKLLNDDLKKKTLDLAIRGKLVHQDTKDEPASVLLERIRDEKKAQLGKKFVDSYIYKGDDNCYYEHIDGVAEDKAVEVPFDLPNNWAWSRIFNISESYIGLTYKPSEITQEGGNIVLRSSNIQDGKLDLTDIVRVNSQITDKLRVNKNDIIICARNGSKKLVGKSAIVDIDLPNLTFGAFMAICKTPFYNYVYTFLQSNLFFTQLAEVSGTTTINQLTQSNFNAFLIPIPPLAEQQCIVDKLNKIFAQI